MKARYESRIHSPHGTLQTPAHGNKGGGGPAEQVDSWKEDGRQKRG